MPEIHFLVRWPDGARQRCYSPSLVVRDYFQAGATYPVGEFLSRSRDALTAAGERVRAEYGFGCSQALAQIGEIERRGAGFHPSAARVTVEGFA